jgi:hypothetical protein
LLLSTAVFILVGSKTESGYGQHKSIAMPKVTSEWEYGLELKTLTQAFPITSMTQFG